MIIGVVEYQLTSMKCGKKHLQMCTREYAGARVVERRYPSPCMLHWVTHQLPSPLLLTSQAADLQKESRVPGFFGIFKFVIYLLIWFMFLYFLQTARSTVTEEVRILLLSCFLFFFLAPYFIQDLFFRFLSSCSSSHSSSLSLSILHAIPPIPPYVESSLRSLCDPQLGHRRFPWGN